MEVQDNGQKVLGHDGCDSTVLVGPRTLKICKRSLAWHLLHACTVYT